MTAILLMLSTFLSLYPSADASGFRRLRESPELEFVYEESMGTCLRRFPDETGSRNEGMNVGHFGPCGGIEGTKDEPPTQGHYELTGAHLWGNFSHSNFSYSDLRSARLSGNWSDVNLEGANLSKALFLTPFFRNARIQGANLTQATGFRDVRAENSYFDAHTQADLSCQELLKRGWSYDDHGMGDFEWACGAQPNSQITLPADQQGNWPGWTFIQRGDEKKAVGIRTDRFRFVPVPYEEWSQDELLCTARWNECRVNRSKLLRKWKMSSFPRIHLQEGIEAVHSPYFDSEGWGPMRWNSMRVMTTFDVVDLQLPVPSSAQSELAAGKFESVEARSLFQDAFEPTLISHWLPRGQIEANCRPLQSQALGHAIERLRCELILEVHPLEGESSHWTERWVENAVRNAPLYSATLRFPLHESLALALGPVLDVLVPMGAMNVQTVDWQMTQRK